MGKYCNRKAYKLVTYTSAPVYFNFRYLPKNMYNSCRNLIAWNFLIDLPTTGPKRVKRKVKRLRMSFISGFIPSSSRRPKSITKLVEVQDLLPECSSNYMRKAAVSTDTRILSMRAPLIHYMQNIQAKRSINKSFNPVRQAIWAEHYMDPY